MFKEVKKPEDIDELEDWMLSDEREWRTKQEQQSVTRWTFPTDIRTSNLRNRQRSSGNSDSDEEDGKDEQKSHISGRRPKRTN